MPHINENADIMKPIQPIIWIIDTSASMAGEKIELIKHILVECEKMLKAKQSDDVECMTELLTFNTDFRWMNGGELIPVNNGIAYGLNLLPKGMTNFGSALNELNNKLSRKSLLKNARSLTPILVFTLDGHSTDDYSSALEALKENKWFRRSIKIGLAIGPEADVELLKEITGEEGTLENPSQFLDIFERLPLYAIGTVNEDEENTKKIAGKIDKDTSLPFCELVSDSEMIIEINHSEYNMYHGEYKIVRCQIGACDFRDADQVCFLAITQADGKTVKLINVDPVPETLYTVYFNLCGHESLELSVDLLDGIIISGNVKIMIKNSSTCEIIGVSDNSRISVVLGNGRQLLMKIGEKYEIETITSKIIIEVKKEWDSWGDDWD